MLPLPIDRAFFCGRIDGISAARSEQLARALAANGLLDAAGRLLSNPRRSAWRGAVRAFAGDDTLRSDASAIAEELNVAYASHEIVADQMGETLDFSLGAIDHPSSNAKPAVLRRWRTEGSTSRSLRS